ncbi:hypothetical protein [Noviherbaspirillum pedocola]|uniref:Uncharacterized protein n=1 Tax=Noviherbaspirillum pedocola TaxID=2801341 RepID=A0A934T015_9BURK|nr:hypothetical protein [Noviherbaspirillum pedocola]MBK4736217.1 hypothetical protein [Noviherbaspirillum pedocola]
MQDDNLYRLLELAYPDLKFERHAYMHDGEERCAIFLIHRDKAILDPTSFGPDVPPFFGLKELHARMLRRRNLHYERTQVHGIADMLAIQAQILRPVAVDPTLLQKNPKDFLLDLGLEEIERDGKTTYRIDDPATGHYLLVSDSKLTGVPQTFADIAICRFNQDGEQLGNAIDINGRALDANT